MPYDVVGGSSGGHVAIVEAPLVVVVSSGNFPPQVTRGGGDYGDDAVNEEKAATVQGSKDGTEELPRKAVYSKVAAYKLYCDYDHHMRFSIQKGKHSPTAYLAIPSSLTLLC